MLSPLSNYVSPLSQKNTEEEFEQQFDFPSAVLDNQNFPCLVKSWLKK